MATLSSNISSTNSKKEELGEDRKRPRVLQQNKPKQSVLMVTDGNLKVLSNKNKKRKSDENTAPAKQRRLDGIYEDPKPLRKKPKTLASVGIQTDESLIKDVSVPEVEKLPSSSSSDDKAEKILHMLTSDTAPSEYWEELAEKRREALEETLVENKALHETNKMLETKVSELKEENTLLQGLVDEAKELAQMVETLTSGTVSDEQ